MEVETVDFTRNISELLTQVEDEVSRITDPEYEQFLADIWVGIVLTLMVLSCVCCMCSCLLYHKFQQWKHRVMTPQRTTVSNLELGQNVDSESLPSYTIVSGLPSYDEALEQLKQAKPGGLVATCKPNENSCTPQMPPTPAPITRLSVAELFQFYKSNSSTSANTLGTTGTKS